MAELFYPPTPELDGPALVTQRLGELTSEASRGEHTRHPIYFFGTVEHEQGIVSGTDAQKIVADPHGEFVQKVAGYSPVVIPENYHPLFETERNAALAEFHHNARIEIEALVPNNKTEQRKKEKWLQAIQTFGIADLINFRLYQEFSTPTLSSTTPRPEVTFGELTTAAHKNSQSGNWLEYRFSNDPRFGWYDAPGVSEYRLNPCPPDEAERRHAIMKKRFHKLAGQYGCILIGDNAQLNLSAYQQVQPQAPRIQFEKADDGTLVKAKAMISPLQPLLGTLDGREQSTLDALTSVSAAYSDGVWLNSSNLMLTDLITMEGKLDFCISTHKPSALRVAPNRLELRDVHANAVAHGFAWLMAAVLDGQQRGWEALAAEGVEPPEIAFEQQVAIAEDSPPESSVVLATLFCAKAHPNTEGSLEFVPPEINETAETATLSMLDAVILEAARVDKDGRLYCTEASVAEAYDSLSTKYGMTNVSPHLLPPKVFKQRLDPLLRGAYFKQQRTFTGNPECRTLSPGWREQKMLGSQVMRIAFGEQLEAYATYLKEAQYARISTGR